MKVIACRLPEVKIIEPDVFGDDRGFFVETWHHARYGNEVTSASFVQDNLSRSRRSTLRGIHFQHPHGQDKLVYVIEGEVFDVAVDVRVGSPTFGQWVSATLIAGCRRQLFVPRGFAHGFCVTSDYALFAYKCTDVYHPETEQTVAWNDPDLAIPWPVSEPTLSAKDTGAPRLREIAIDRLPRYEG